MSYWAEDSPTTKNYPAQMSKHRGGEPQLPRPSRAPKRLPEGSGSPSLNGK